MKFCGQCGALLQYACRSCGAANSPENRFCGQCGAPLDKPALRASDAAELYTSQTHPVPIVAAGNMLPGEMKQVSVLFCDIVNSTPLTERLGPEAMRDLVSAFLETSLAEVHRYGGTAPQFTGDGFLALFGAPLTHEDHVRRALLAAVAIRQALSDDEFIRRFLLHVLPKGFHRIRHYGLLASAGCKANIARARELMAPMPGLDPPVAHDTADLHTTTDHRPPCPCCGGRMIIVELFARGGSPRGPPSSGAGIGI